jgi:hypothetical protein
MMRCCENLLDIGASKPFILDVTADPARENTVIIGWMENHTAFRPYGAYPTLKMGCPSVRVSVRVSVRPAKKSSP